ANAALPECFLKEPNLDLHRFVGFARLFFRGRLMAGVTISNNKSKSMFAKKGAFNAQAFLDSAGVARKIKEFKKAELVYSQGDAAKSVMYGQEGGVKLSVVNEVGKERSEERRVGKEWRERPRGGHDRDEAAERGEDQDR